MKYKLMIWDSAPGTFPPSLAISYHASARDAAWHLGLKDTERSPQAIVWAMLDPLPETEEEEIAVRDSLGVLYF